MEFFIFRKGFLPRDPTGIRENSKCLILLQLFLIFCVFFFRAEREKVRVSFFQQSKPQEVDLPDETCFITDADFVMATTVAENNAGHISYNRTER